MNYIKQYVKDLGEAVRDLDLAKFKAHWQKYQHILPPMPSNELVLEVTMYKTAVNRTDMPTETHDKAEAWLTEHGYSTELR